ncbi:MAG: hypothetical protein A2498_06115 [Lentisphaerae bacterium RIFOXYC12_FULL_60_16]|nr:MAG: hypothetical protein A2498_06115 [Lentisphaerae bacterium RIFOXYC12_FULL_60_16]
MKRYPTVCGVLLLLLGTLHAGIRTWDGSTGNWSDTARWGGTVPQDGDEVFINSGIITVHAETDRLLSLTMNGGSLIFTNWSTVLHAVTITINNNATITLAPAFFETGMSNRVYLSCSNLVLASTATINADARGFRGGTNEWDEGDGPGGGRLTTSYYGGGGGHGGRGGDGNSGLGGVTNDSINAPVISGSGGGGNGAGHGGGMVRIQASGTVTMDGVVTADGGTGSPHGGGGSGGAIFISCRAFGGNTTGTMKANGGNATWHSSIQYGGGAGGGRIAVAIGMTDADVQRLIDGEPVDNLFSYQQHGSYPGVMSATPGVDLAGGVNMGHVGEPGTCRFVSIADASNFWVRVCGDPAEYADPLPYAYGFNPGIPGGTWITNTVTSPFDAGAGSGSAVLNWKVTHELGAVFAQGEGATAVFQVNTNLILTYYWTNLYQCAVVSANGAQGSVNSGTVNGWYTNGVTVTNLMATPEPGYEFNRWTGIGVLSGMETVNPLTVEMTGPRLLIANFASLSGERRTWSGAGEWIDAGRWTPIGMPGLRDQAAIVSGTVSIPHPVWAGSLVVSNGATVIFTNWHDGVSAQSVDISGTITLPAAFEETAMSNRVRITCTTFTLADGGKIDVKGRGFIGGRNFIEEGHGPGKGRLSGGYYGGGGGHGGTGGEGKAGAGGITNDAVNAPTIPGSGGGGNGGGTGGGAVWISASRIATLNGVIDADGIGGTPHGGGGSGGSIFIACGDFQGGTTGVLRANGGNAPYYSAVQYGGSGAGGRIAVVIGAMPADLQRFLDGRETRFPFSSSHPAYLGTASVNPGTNGSTPDGEAGTLRFIIAPASGLVLVVR